MKRFNIAVLALVLLTAMSTAASATTARLQVIHNAADPGAAVVDIYVNGDLFIDEFAFRAATEFRTVPAGVELNIGVAPGGDSTPGDIIATIPVTLAAGKTYVAVANGVLDPTMFAANPDGKSIGFTLLARDRIREGARWSSLVDIIALHGATDAPTVDILARDSWWNPLVDNLSYGEFSGYRTLFAKKYILDVTPGNDNSTVVASFVADLSGLRGGAAVVFASGFLDPSANKGGEGFGLFAALPNGVVVELPAEAQEARLQVIHNSADPGAAVVDVYVNDNLFIDEFAFRSATEFKTVPAGVELNIGVAPGGDSSAEDIIGSIPVTLEAGKTYVAVANGVLSPDDFAPNPEGRSTAFTLFARDGVRENSRLYWFTKVMALHGASDAPAVDISVETNWGKWRLFKDLSYGDFSDYRLVPPRKVILDVTPAGDNTVVASFEADLRGLRGGTAIVFASGFLSPEDNQNGEAFGLYAALPTGQVVALPAVATKRKTANNGPMLAPGLEAGTTGLSQNFPNPFNPSTTISFALAQDAPVRLDVFNARGQLVQTLVDGNLAAGPHSVAFDGNRLASGVYFYRMTAGTFSEIRKMVLVK
jgi:hypothetical protein